jgi:hypothetical protein
MATGGRDRHEWGFERPSLLQDIKNILHDYDAKQIFKVGRHIRYYFMELNFDYILTHFV